MKIELHPHARERLAERGATETEVRATVEAGEPFPAKLGRSGFRRNFPFDGTWRGRSYAAKQVEVYAGAGRWRLARHHGRDQVFWREGAQAMKLTYDPRQNIAYLRLQEKTGEIETIRVSDELNVDIAPDGTVYGIELLNANEQLGAADDGLLVIVNQALGEQHDVRLVR
jgi:uncharacterized protein YuzE